MRAFDPSAFDDRQPGDVLLALTGDVNVQHRVDPKQAFQHVLPLLAGADIVFGQLECPLTASTTAAGKSDIPHKPRWEHADPRMVEGLRHAGFTAMSLASNVAHPRAVGAATATVLEAAGIGHCGAGENLAAARRPAIVARGGFRFGFLSYTSVFWPYDHAATDDLPGCATIKAYTAYQPGVRAIEMPGSPPAVTTWPDVDELAAMQADVRALKSQVDVVVLSCHWGVSSSTVTADYQREIARAAVAAGADLIFGHHPHVVQGVEIIEGKPVFYSLGNFAFDWTAMLGKYREGLLLECLFREGRLASWRCTMVQRNAENDIAPLDSASPDGIALAESFRDLSAGFGSTVTLKHSWLVAETARS